MTSPSRVRPKRDRVVIWSMGALLAAFAFSSGKGNQIAGLARVVSVDQEKESDGEACELPGNAPRALYAAFSQGQVGASRAGTTADDEAQRGEVARRRPLRAIGDPYGLFSAVGVDLANNEVILQDENLFRILVYDRKANTPPSATLTEPKRFIAGDRTNLALNCALYVDPK